MLSAWLQHVEVRLSGATFEHRSFDLLTDSTQPWLVAAIRDVRFDVRLRPPGTKACLLAVCRTTSWLCDPEAMLRGRGEVSSSPDRHERLAAGDGCTAPTLPQRLLRPKRRGGSAIQKPICSVPCCSDQHGGRGGPIPAAVRADGTHAAGGDGDSRHRAQPRALPCDRCCRHQPAGEVAHAAGEV